MNGIKKTSITNGKTNETSGDLEIGVYSSGEVDVTSESITVETKEGIGVSQACKNLGLKAVDKCKEKHAKCMNEAKGQAALMTDVVVEDPVSLYRARIDKELLGLSSNSSIGDNTNILAPEVPFRSLKQNALESNHLYLNRLMFLGNLSDFFKTESFNDNEKIGIITALASAQSDFLISINYV